MTPKEALELLKRKAHTYDDEYCLPRMDCKKELDDKTEEAYQRLLKSLTELEELKRYPTSDEVCKALSEYLKEPIKYDDVIQIFYSVYEDEIETYARYYKGREELQVVNILPPHLITLIGKFYEGVGK